MKAIRRTWILLLLLGAIAFQLPAQQTEADVKLFEEVKTKAEKGDAEAQYSLGQAYGRGIGVSQNETEAIKWYRKSAESGSAKGQNFLGGMYYTGNRMPQNRAEGIKWYGKAAEQGFADAQNMLGAIYRAGGGVTKDSATAVKWYRMSAEQGNAKGQAMLAVCYLVGDGVAKDANEAVKWYRKAAEQGNEDAQYSLGLCYERGNGVIKDAVEAVKWFQICADQDYAASQLSLGLCYYDGTGVAKNTIKAVQWFRKAADQGYAAAQSILGHFLITGEDVPKDYVEAYKWLNLAGAQGDKRAQKALQVVENLMTPEQIAEAQRLSREFKPLNKSTSGDSVSDTRVADFNPTVSGTGFFISEDGYLISNNHVVAGAGKVRLVTSAGLISAKVVKVDAANDLALLKAEGRFAPLPLSPSRGVKLGGTVATVGFPNIGLQGFAPKLAKGEIASLSGAGDDARYFQISVPVQPGNSGGALVDERGNVVGVVSAKLNASAALALSGTLPENVNYAVKSSYLLSFLESVPDVASKLKEASGKEKKFEDVVKEAEQAAVLVLVY